MRPIPLNLLTLYADLQQSVFLDDTAGSITRRKIKGRDYLYVTTKDGAARLQRSLGPADSPDVQVEAQRIRSAAARARSRRTTVSALKQARIPAPSLQLGRIMEAVANAGLFKKGAVLVGTAAYQTYSCLVGAYLPDAALMTNDADILVASLVSGGEQKDLEAILKRADPTFAAHLNPDDKLPNVFRSDDGFQVDILTKFGRGRTSPVLVHDLTCSAVALKFMEYLADESIEVAALYGAGVLVRVPPPIRYAVHKLLIAQERRDNFSPKKQKDLAQARDLLAAIRAREPDLVEDELAATRKRGPAWRKNIAASLADISRIPA